MGAIYTTGRGAHTLSTSNDSITIDVPAGRFFYLHRAKIVGMANALAAGAEIGIYRVATVGSAGTPTELNWRNIDPNGAAPPSGFTARFGYTTQPVLGDLLKRLYVQPAGGKDEWIAMPGGALAFWLSTAYQVSIRGISGTPNIAIDLEGELL